MSTLLNPILFFLFNGSVYVTTHCLNLSRTIQKSQDEITINSRNSYLDKDLEISPDKSETETSLVEYKISRNTEKEVEGDMDRIHMCYSRKSQLN